MIKKAAVLGSGSWGTALAEVLAPNAETVSLWGRNLAVCNQINDTHMNSVFLPNLPLKSNIKGTLDLEEALHGATLVVNGLPTKAIKSVFSALAKKIPENCPVVNSSKGLCAETLTMPTDILRVALQRKNKSHIYILSGPSFASETVKHQATAVTFAGSDLKDAEKVGGYFFNSWFRTYPSTDLIGVEVAGAFKNIIAIAAGMAEGLGLGFNTQSALITRGLAEITRFGLTLGADPMTFLGLAGMGDLVLTCTGSLSRNRTLGKTLAQGKTLQEAQLSLGQVAEGVYTTESVHALVKGRGLDLPIASEVYNILFKNKKVAQALNDLMSRPMRSEVP